MQEGSNRAGNPKRVGVLRLLLLGTSFVESEGGQGLVNPRLREGWLFVLFILSAAFALIGRAIGWKFIFAMWCSRPLAGLGGLLLVNLESRRWHCFGNVGRISLDIQISCLKVVLNTEEHILKGLSGSCGSLDKKESYGGQKSVLGIS